VCSRHEIHHPVEPPHRFRPLLRESYRLASPLIKSTHRQTRQLG
jgi:hypothetical protein